MYTFYTKLTKQTGLVSASNTYEPLNQSPLARAMTLSKCSALRVKNQYRRYRNEPPTR